MTAGFGDKVQNKRMKTKKYQYERTLSPLSEREFSSEDEELPTKEEQKDKRKKEQDPNKNLFINFADQ